MGASQAGGGIFDETFVSFISSREIFYYMLPNPILLALSFPDLEVCPQRRARASERESPILAMQRLHVGFCARNKMHSGCISVCSLPALCRQKVLPTKLGPLENRRPDLLQPVGGGKEKA